MSTFIIVDFTVQTPEAWRRRERRGREISSGEQRRDTWQPTQFLKRFKLVSNCTQKQFLFFIYLFSLFGSLPRLLSGSSSAENKLVKLWRDSTVISIYGGKLIDIFFALAADGSLIEQFLA